MRIFHIATAADWERARTSGAYTTSTVGRTLEEEGFLHAARREQVTGVFQRYYRDAGQPLVLLTIDTERLGVPWREDPVGSETYPHIYGPLSPRSVVGVQPLDRRGVTQSFTSLFLLAFAAMFLAVAGSLIGRTLDTEWGEFGGAVAGFVVGGVVATVVLRRRHHGSALRRRA
jgi:uncharacterized protein (DUF952 family)